MIFNVGSGGASSADKVKYDNRTSGLKATNVQGAVDEVNNSLNELSKNDIATSVDISSYTEQNPYIFPSDGYVWIELQAKPENYLYGSIISNDNNNRFTVQVTGGYAYVRTPVYVRKGMKWVMGVSLGTNQVRFYAFQ